jgi:hypothetical protein
MFEVRKPSLRSRLPFRVRPTTPNAFVGRFPMIGTSTSLPGMNSSTSTACL